MSHSPAPAIEVGEAIYRLGSAIHAGEISTPEAVLQLMAVDPSLSAQGARAQLGCWKTARTRYAADTGPLQARVAGHGDARRFRVREPLHFHCNRGA
jgi:hypothetical protein